MGQCSNTCAVICSSSICKNRNINATAHQAALPWANRLLVGLNFRGVGMQSQFSHSPKRTLNNIRARHMTNPHNILFFPKVIISMHLSIRDQPNLIVTANCTGSVVEMALWRRVHRIGGSGQGRTVIVMKMRFLCLFGGEEISHLKHN